jgi:excisionase family DNA binding protein
MSTEGTAVLTIGELAEYLEIPKSTLDKPAQKGERPGQEVGRRRHFRKDTVCRWLDGWPGAADRARGREV